MSGNTRKPSPVGSSALAARGIELSQLLVLHHDQIRRLVVRGAGAGLLRFYEPEDLIQEVVAEALSHPGNFAYRSEDQFFRWITTVADRVLCARARGAQRIPPPLGSQDGDGGATTLDGARVWGRPPRTPSSVASQRERGEQLRAAIALLPPKERDAIDIFYFQGYSIEEYAAKSGCSDGAVVQCFARAISQLRRQYERISS